MSYQTTFLSLSIAIFVTIGCQQQKSQEASVGEMLQDPQKQEKIMDTICSDHEMMHSMMGHMKENDHAMQMMMQDQQMMGHMMKGDHMMNMMQENPEMMENMMGHMMTMMENDSTLCMNMQGIMENNDHMRGMMMDMMEDEGMMMEEGSTEEMPMHRHNGMH